MVVMRSPRRTVILLLCYILLERRDVYRSIYFVGMADLFEELLGPSPENEWNVKKMNYHAFYHWKQTWWRSDQGLPLRMVEYVVCISHCFCQVSFVESMRGMITDRDDRNDYFYWMTAQK